MKVKVLYKKNSKSLKKNFLNNQNYILWKTEKKKLLSKFFIEKNIKNIYLFFSKINILFTEKNKNLASFSIVSFAFVYASIMSMYTGWFFISILFIIVIIFIINIFIINNLSIGKNELTVKNFYSYFFIKKWYTLSWIVILLVTFMFIILFLGIVINISSLILFVFLFLILIWVLLFFGVKFKLNKLKWFNLIIFPLVILYQLILSIFIFIYIFFIKWVNWYSFIKQKPNSWLLKKFKKIRKNSASNEFYKIELK